MITNRFTTRKQSNILYVTMIHFSLKICKKNYPEVFFSRTWSKLSYLHLYICITKKIIFIGHLSLCILVLSCCCYKQNPFSFYKIKTADYCFSCMIPITIHYQHCFFLIAEKSCLNLASWFFYSCGRKSMFQCRAQQPMRVRKMAKAWRGINVKH